LQLVNAFKQRGGFFEWGEKTHTQNGNGKVQKIEEAGIAISKAPFISFFLNSMFLLKAIIFYSSKFK